ncbi:uncharacterized protein LOC120846898 [Ixodes scapularis]|uniref:uncharacterized protein LOC120846898 n=1 Tax=Ixodes scapularis TaxID=6945 RepID=UPI001A9E568B|nr:uncharacterized protein LOC120846898 [Ixodes scapularis]
MEKASEIAPQRRRRAAKLNSDPEVVARQLAVERKKTEQKEAKRAAETSQQRKERLAKRRHQEAERRARPSQQQQQQNAIINVKARRLTDYTVKLSESASATRTVETEFVNNPFGCVCDVCERLWHMKDLTPVSSALRETLSLAAPPTQWGTTIDLVYQRKIINSKYCVKAIETAACYYTDHRAVFVAIEKQPDVEQKK